ncbi:MAG: hypothetical protein K0S11_1025 [Gammaproteobacteria bacterium]|jgi:hypothetical protein|nr:hypothetical protein [Gammaproteobacteria bacterium]
MEGFNKKKTVIVTGNGSSLDWKEGNFLEMLWNIKGR